jgi:hypothetical protein
MYMDDFERCSEERNSPVLNDDELFRSTTEEQISAGWARRWEQEESAARKAEEVEDARQEPEISAGRQAQDTIVVARPGQG